MHPTKPVALRMRLGGQTVEVVLPIPEADVQSQEMMPVFQILTDTFVAAAVSDLEQSGRCVTCRLGCAACCRQVIPLTPAETKWIRQVVETLPPSQQAAVRARFSAVLQRLTEAGLREALENYRDLSDEALLSLANAYVELELRCPFLEDESCTIYADRPIACREYLVTSPPENCYGPGPRQIERVPIPASMSKMVGQFGQESQPGGRPYLPLVLALERTAEPPAETPQPGIRILEQLLSPR